MAAIRNNARLQVGSAPWIEEERASALQIVEQESEEFSFSARNDLDWLNEHMAEIFSENQINVTDIFKTPGKLRGKTPRTVQKRNPLETRAPLTDVFSTTPRTGPSPFRQPQFDKQSPKFRVAEDVQDQSAVTEDQRRMAFIDSGYHGTQHSQSQSTQATEIMAHSPPHPLMSKMGSLKTPPRPEEVQRTEQMAEIDAEERRTTEGSFQSAREEQTAPTTTEGVATPEDGFEEPIRAATPLRKYASPLRTLRNSPSPLKQSPLKIVQSTETESFPVVFEDARSSDGSSPIRPAVRKSSLNFASLPAREPLTTKKSIGGRTSRTSHLEQSRTSYYGRHTGVKSIGGMNQDEHDEEDMGNEDLEEIQRSRQGPKEDIGASIMHNKTSTQRLQDQINMLGKLQSQPHRPSKSIPNIVTASSTAPIQAPTKTASPARKEVLQSAPGAFPDDEEDSWIGPPTTAVAAARTIFSPRPERPTMIKSHTTAVMENIGQQNAETPFTVPKQRSPMKEVPDRTNSPRGYMKSASTSVIGSPSKGQMPGSSLKKGISASNPDLARAARQPSASPSKSPSRTQRDSPLKAAKDKISSILKTSRGLFASSAATSAEAHTIVLSPTTTRPGHKALEDVFRDPAPNDTITYPSLEVPPSPGPGRKAERDDDKRKEKEYKEARMMQEQLEKLEKIREKESQKARVFSQEQERVAAMKKKTEEQKEVERQAKAAQEEVPKSTRTSPRKTKAQLEAEGRAAAAIPSKSVEQDMDMSDAKSVASSTLSRGIGLSSIAKPTKARVPKPAIQAPGRVTKPTQAPLHIRVHTGAAHGGTSRNPAHPSNGVLAASLGESLSAASSSTSLMTGRTPIAPALNQKPSAASVSSFKSSTTKKPAALAAAARKKELDDREAQRRQNNKLEIHRKRAAEEEERKQDQQRQEEEKKLESRQQLALQEQARAQRQVLEKAKTERPPPPPSRFQDGLGTDKPLLAAPSLRETGPPRPMSRINNVRPQDERMQQTTNHASGKAVAKRTLPQDVDEYSRPTLQRNGPSYTQNADKRRRTGEEVEQTQEPLQRSNIGAPIRQSTIRPKDGVNKSLFASGYAAVPGPSQGAPNIFNQSARPAQQAQKSMHPIDMATHSKAPINFAANPAHKTPARPAAALAAKSTSKTGAKSSPRYQNGETIDLPEINTDSEDEDDSDSENKKDFAVPTWANSPNLLEGIVRQESIDPASVFGPPRELKMEEVFRNKDRWHKFRQRTSSANWSGTDRLTDDEVRKDLEAREKLRREGGWSYGMMG